LLALAAVTACGSSSGLAPGAGDTGPLFTLRGTVVDSLASVYGVRWSAPGVLVNINGHSTETDSAGRFVLADVPGGAVPVELLSNAFERISRVMTIESDLPLRFQLRRQAPLIAGFRSLGDSAWIRVVDLQGRKTIDRWLATNATLVGPASRVTQHGLDWRWHAIDARTYRVVLPTTTGADQIFFEIHDVTGFTVRAVCDTSGSCDNVGNAVGGQF